MKAASPLFMARFNIQAEQSTRYSSFSFRSFSLSVVYNATSSTSNRSLEFSASAEVQIALNKFNRMSA
jgi:hypothetical protein